MKLRPNMFLVRRRGEAESSDKLSLVTFAPIKVMAAVHVLELALPPQYQIPLFNHHRHILFVQAGKVNLNHKGGIGLIQV
jgi:hypothetical protein